jgi:hypothetical protein
VNLLTGGVCYEVLGGECFLTYRCSDTAAQWHSSTAVQKYRGTEVQRYSGTKLQVQVQAQAQRSLVFVRQRAHVRRLPFVKARVPVLVYGHLPFFRFVIYICTIFLYRDAAESLRESQRQSERERLQKGAQRGDHRSQQSQNQEQEQEQNLGHPDTGTDANVGKWASRREYGKGQHDWERAQVCRI